MHTADSLGRFSIGVGDRFGRQAGAQLQACILAAQEGVTVTPAWNKSNREHQIIGSEPSDVRLAADAAVHEAGWNAPYFVDADHIRLDTLERFLAPCNFFTIDVADAIGRAARPADVDTFVHRHPELLEPVALDGLADPLRASADALSRIAALYLPAVAEAARVYRTLADARGANTFVTEVSMDETDTAQSPLDLLVILVALADQAVPLQTIAPKFSGRFNKGVDYVGDVAGFEREFDGDLCVVAHAVRHYGLPAGLKLSVHSGSDKFSLYPAIRRCIERRGAGLHLKTAGTTWLEEVIGLA